MKLGDKVRVKSYYQRNGIKPNYSTEDIYRYKLKECDREGIIAGKRNIHQRVGGGLIID